MASYTLSPVGGAGAQFFTNSGVPLAGGKLYTYQAGTTTLQTTWTNPSGQTANANPIILDSAGRPSSAGSAVEIWLSVAYTYKFVLKDSNDVTIATYDNVPGLPQPATVNDASSLSYEQGNYLTAGSFITGSTYQIKTVGTTDFTAIGASYNSVGQIFVATGAGTGTGTAYNSQTIQNKLQQVISVKDFGATGDGVTDDTAAIQAAFDAVESVGGGMVFVPWPAQMYRITSTLLIPDHTKFFGAGMTDPSGSDGVQFDYIGTDAAIALKGGESLTANARGVSIEGIGVNLATAGATGFRLRRCRDVMMLGCAVDMNADSQIGFHLKGNRDGAVSAGVFDCNFFRLASYADATYTNAIHYKLEGDASSGTSGRCNSNYFYGIRAGGGGKGLEVGPSINNAFYGIEFEALTGNYIQCLSGATYNGFYDCYLSDIPAGWTSKIFQCDAGSSFNVLRRYNTNSNYEQEVVLQTSNRAEWILSDVFIGSISSRFIGARVQGTNYNTIELKGDGLYGGLGLTNPVSIFPAQTVEQTNYSTTLATYTPDAITGRIKSIRFDAGSTGTLTIDPPTNANQGETLYFHIYNNSGGSIALTWDSAGYIKNTTFPTSIANGARIALTCQRAFSSAQSWVMVGSANIMP